MPKKRLFYLYFLMFFLLSAGGLTPLVWGSEDDSHGKSEGKQEEKSPAERFAAVKERLEKHQKKDSHHGRRDSRGGKRGDNEERFKKVYENFPNLSEENQKLALDGLEQLAALHSMTKEERSNHFRGSRGYGSGGNPWWDAINKLERSGAFADSNPGGEGNNYSAGKGGRSSSNYVRDREQITGPSWGSKKALTDAYMRERQPKKAAQAASQWVAMDPQNPEAFIALGNAHHEIGYADLRPEEILPTLLA